MQYGMRFFWDTIIHPLLTKAGTRSVVEIGTEYGGLTRKLAEYCGEHGGTVHTIDVKTSIDVDAWQQEFGGAFSFHNRRSLQVLPELHGYDVVIIDGDHNWYTVFHELTLIAEEGKRTGMLPLILLHDVGWPFGRRDFYYDPDAIPPEHKQTLEQKGIVPGSAALVAGKGFGRHEWNAVREGGARNGVLTAAEDFLKEHMPDAILSIVPGMFGLGIIASRARLQTQPALQSFLDELHLSLPVISHIEALEKERAEEMIRIEDLQIALQEHEKTMASMHREKEVLVREKEILAEEQNALRRHRTDLEAQLARTYATWSWRITAPLRSLQRGVQRLTGWDLKRAHTKRDAPQTPPPPSTPLSFEHTSSPQATIVIPVFGKIKYTHQCLASIRQNTQDIPYEVIVVDDCSPDETGEVLAKISGITVLKNEKNSGFTHSCNRGAAAARAPFVVFLNNDTLVHKGWLSALLRTFKDHERVGVAGAKFLTPEGKLLEAGSLIWKDGSGWNIGRGDDPEKPAYNFVRDVDYCSGACIAIPATLFRTLGGFDARFAPAYYEDTDLCFSAKKIGYRVLYQPHCVITHYESITAGKDESTGAKRYLGINRTKFRNKWSKELTSHPQAPSSAKAWEETRRGHPSVLVIDHSLPRADHDSGALRMVHMLRLLRTLVPSVTFIGADLEDSEEYRKVLESMGIEVLKRPFITSINKYFAECGALFDTIILSREPVASEHMENVKYFAPKARIIFDTVDLHFLRTEREADIANDPHRRVQARHQREDELFTASLADCVITVSEEEKAIIRKEFPEKDVVVVSNIHEAQSYIPGWREREGLLFIGGFLHPPNVDAIEWFMETMYPLVKGEIPDVHLWIAGSNPPDAIRKLGSADISVTGYLPDLTPLLRRSRVSIAPLRFGAGVKGKITQSLSHGVPVVTTSVGAEGIGLTDGKDALIADTPEAFAAAVSRLYRDQELWNTLSRNGPQIIRSDFSRERARAGLMEALKLRRE